MRVMLWCESLRESIREMEGRCSRWWEGRSVWCVVVVVSHCGCACCGREVGSSLLGDIFVISSCGEAGNPLDIIILIISSLIFLSSHEIFRVYSLSGQVYGVSATFTPVAGAAGDVLK